MRRVLLLVLVLAATVANARTLSWKSLDVRAHLDRDGELRIVERHRMLFDGDWNGGERLFRVEPGQDLELVSISRVDEGDVVVPIEPASFDGSRLRWRAREPDDPPFRNRELTYLIDYKLRNVVARAGTGYDLDHDFAFAERPGVIERYTLDLSFDPVWQPGAGFVSRIERTNLPPGTSVIVKVPLTWSGEGAPRFIGDPVQRAVVIPSKPMPIVWKLGAAALLLIVAAAIWFPFIRREAAAGRYAPPPEVNRLWLDRNLMVHRAEVVGAAWDSNTGQAEVAALIAIMSMEGKIANIPGAKPKLRLLVPRETLSEYERAFVDKLFIQGEEIDPETIRKHYAKTGFDPASTLRVPLQTAAANLVGKSTFFAGCAMVIGGVVVSNLAGLHMLLFFIVSVVLAVSYRMQLRGPKFASLIPVPLVIAGLATLVFTQSLLFVAAALIVPLALIFICMSLAGWKGNAFELENLRKFRAAREFFRKTLTGPNPDIDERWIPYILAFGLGTELDRWFVAVPSSMPSTFRTTGSGGGSSSAPSFAGGGGGFGGAGATGGWASSIGSFAAAVPSPGSSSSGSGSRSGGGGGGGRSGGGGGGGW